MKRFLVRGLAAMFPFILTFAVLFFCVKFVIESIGEPIATMLRGIGIAVWGKENAPILLGDAALATGVVIAFLFFFVAGFFFASFIGRRIYRHAESWLKKIPGVSTVYPIAKQLTGFVIPGADKKMEFKQVVLVPFPTMGIYAIGFVTSDGLQTLQEKTSKKHYCVFVPTSPTPFGGFIVYAPEDTCIKLPIKPDEAFKILISGGIVVPEKEVPKLAS